MLYLILILILVLVAVLGTLSLRRVGSGERLVVERRGKVRRTAVPGIAFSVPLLEQSRRVDMNVRRRSVLVSGSTADGATARIRVEFAVAVTDAALAPAEVDAEVITAVENRLHKDVASRTVRELPSRGEMMPWEPAGFVPGVRVERAEVKVCDVETTGDLRRLVEDLRKA